MDHDSVIAPDVREPLESLFPPGIFSDFDSAGSKNAMRALRIMEKMVQEAVVRNTLYARFSLLQSFPRLGKDEGGKGTGQVAADFVRQYCVALCPDSYAEFLSSLSDDEIEVFLKNYVHAHETWAHPHGVAALVRTMLESSLHGPVNVRIPSLEGEDRVVPEDLHSMLGRRERYSTLGRNFILGRRCTSRPTGFEVLIGPITPAELQSFQRSGWAEGSAPGWKLRRLAEFAAPFYMSTNLRFLFEAKGFVLGKASVGSHRLGVVGGAMEENLGLLVGS